MDAINVSTSATTAAHLLSSKNIRDTDQKKVLGATYTLLGQLILQHVHKMNERSVTNCLWSLGKVVDKFGIEKKQEYKHVFGKLCERAMVVTPKMTLQAASNSLWAMAKFQWGDVNLIQKFVKLTIEQSKKEFEPQDVSNTLWAIATLKYSDIKTIQHFVELSKTCVHEMNGQGVGNLMWALQQLRYYDDELVLQIEDNIINNENIIFNSQNISNTMFAFTDLGLQNKQKIFKIFVQQFISCKVIKLQEWINFLYALAVLDCPLYLTQNVVKELLAQQKSNLQSYQDIQLLQIQLAQIFYNIRKLQLDFPPDLKQNCKKEFQLYMRKQIHVQNSLREVVFQILKSHFDFAKKNTLIYDDQICINIALQNGESKVAVMTNPRQSYFVNFPEKMLGRCQRQKFLLEQLGWQVVEVSAYKWNNPQYRLQIINDIKIKFES